MLDKRVILRNPGGWNNGKAVIGIMLFAVLVNIPFVNQAFHMDDGIYLTLAEGIQNHFWSPQEKPIYFEGLNVEDMASTEHPWPVTSYLLSICAKIAGSYSEIAMHGGFLIFPALIAVSMYYLAARFTRSPVCTTLAFLTLPAVYVLSHTVMTDIPLAAFWIASTALFCRGADSGNRMQTWSGALAAAIASLISYSGLCLVPLLSLYAVLRKNRGALAAILILPAGLLGFVLVLNSLHYGRFTPKMLLDYYFFAKRVLAPSLLLEKLIFAVLVLGTTAIVPLVLLGRNRKKRLLLTFSTAVGIAWLILPSSYSAVSKLLFVLLFWGGLLAVIEVVGRVPAILRSRTHRDTDTDEFFLSIWFAGWLIFCVAAYMNGSARYLIPAMPPLILIVFRRIESLSDGRSRRWIRAATISAGVSLALLMAISDYQFADIYREFASRAKRIYSAPDSRWWFTGEWGFRVYLERAGAQELGRRDPSPKPGDLLMVPSLADPYKTLFSDSLDLNAIAIVAPSRIHFDVSAISPDCVLRYTIGMPFYDKSDGMRFSVRFSSPDREKMLSTHELTLQKGSRWEAYEIPLKEIAGKRGVISFAAEIGPSGNADADWIALARARICKREGDREKLVYDFRENLGSGRIEREPGLQYHTEGNLPVLPMTVWLNQEPAVVLRGRFEYNPPFRLRLLDAGCHAGFWSSGWGLLPVSIAEKGAALETISVYEITRPVDAYGESSPVWYRTQ
jgi:hypothetical protein